MDKVYVVMESDGWHLYIRKVFDNQKLAEKYAQLLEKLEGFNSYYVNEYEIDRLFDDKTEAEQYYVYQINTDDTIKEADDYNDSELEYQISNGENGITVEGPYHYTGGDYYTVKGFSKQSYTVARELAIKKYKELRKCS